MLSLCDDVLVLIIEYSMHRRTLQNILLTNKTLSQKIQSNNYLWYLVYNHFFKKKSIKHIGPVNNDCFNFSYTTKETNLNRLYSVLMKMGAENKYNGYMKKWMVRNYFGIDLCKPYFKPEHLTILQQIKCCIHEHYLKQKFQKKKNYLKCVKKKWLEEKLSTMWTKKNQNEYEEIKLELESLVKKLKQLEHKKTLANYWTPILENQLKEL